MVNTTRTFLKGMLRNCVLAPLFYELFLSYWHIEHTHTTYTSQIHTAQSAGAVEYTADYISPKRYDSPNKCPGYDIKPSDSETPVLEI